MGGVGRQYQPPIIILILIKMGIVVAFFVNILDLFQGPVDIW
jgi:hypothetical protein